MKIDLNHPSPLQVAPATNLMRYSDVGKFFDLLSTSELHFSRQDLLRLVDPREGRIPDVARRDMLDLRRMSADEIRKDGRFQPGQEEMLKKSAELMFEGWENFARTAFVNCWHMASTESMAMWGMYGGGGGSVAVVTSVDRLCDACEPSDEMIGGGIRYINPHSAEFEWGNMFNTVFRKHRGFEFEHEFRLVISTWGDKLKDGQKFKELLDSREFLRVRVALPRLIKGIIPSPNLPAREKALVSKLASDYGLADRVKESELAFQA